MLRLRNKRAITECHHKKYMTMTEFRLWKKKLLSMFCQNIKSTIENFSCSRCPETSSYSTSGNTKVYTSIRLMAYKMAPVDSVFDASSAPSLIHKDVVKDEQLNDIQGNNRSPLENTTNQQLSTVGTIMLHV